MIHLTIDGKSIEVPERTTVLQAARLAGIKIPTLCDHPALKPFGSCRLCVVEIDGFRTLQASCTLPAGEGMVVRTNTPALQESRKFILSLLFSERNHFCMYCQKTDGDCELQNCAYAEDMDHWPMQPNWNPFPVDTTHPYYVLDNNRCILCRRCVRACGELVGNFTLGIENRGSRSMLIADYGVDLGESSCIKCGTCVQVCPTGALIDKQSAYVGKDSTAEHIKSVCVGCSVGCGIDLVVHDNQLVHINGDWDAPLNGGLMCEEGRYKSLFRDRQRVTTPMLRKNGKLEPVAWDEAVQAVANQVAPLKGKEKGIGALVSTRLPVEALYQFTQVFARGLNSSMVAGIEEGATTAALSAFPGEANALSGNLDALKTADCVLALGVDLADSHQVAGFFIKRNVVSGTKLIVIDPYENSMEPTAEYMLRPAASKDYELLLGVMAAIQSLGLAKGEAKLTDLAGYTVARAAEATGISAETITAAARQIASAQKPVFVYGKGLTTQPAAIKLLQALLALSHMVGGATLVGIKGKANSLAAHKLGLDKSFNAQGFQAAYLALGDDEPSKRLVKAVEGAAFLAVQASYVSPLTEKADVVLPVEMWAEQDGHYLNLDARLQAAHQGLKAPEGVLSNMAVFKKLSGCLNLTTDENWEEAIN